MAQAAHPIKAVPVVTAAIMAAVPELRLMAAIQMAVMVDLVMIVTTTLVPAAVAVVVSSVAVAAARLFRVTQVVAVVAAVPDRSLVR
jgi:hypothetical protein